MNKGETLELLKNLYGEEHGLLRYLLMPQYDNQEGEIYDNLNEIFKNARICDVHKDRKVECVCLHSICSGKRLICILCLLESHKHHGSKIFKIDEICEFIAKNASVLLQDNANSQFQQLNKTLDEQKTILLQTLEEFYFKTKTQITEFFDKLKTKEEKIQPIHEMKNFNHIRNAINQRLNLLSLLTIYNEDFTLKETNKMDNLKAELINKTTFVKDYIEKQIKEFKNNVKAAFEVILRNNKDLKLEDFSQIAEEKKLKFEEREAGKEKLSEKIEFPKPQLPEKRQSIPIDSITLKRLPCLPARFENYWPITHKKVEGIGFKPLRERITLVGFTQLKIINFENKIAKFLVKLKEQKFENNEEEMGDKYIISFSEVPSFKIILEQEMQILPEDNEESNFLYFSKKIPLKIGYRYILELTALRGYGCTCKYGLSNQENLQENNIFEFQTVQDQETAKIQECSMMSQEHSNFRTDLTQGMFPSLIYKIEMSNNL